MTFSQLLTEAVRRKKNPVLVGLDPRLESLPESILEKIPKKDNVSIAVSFATFCHEVIDVVAPLVPAVKPQVAFFEQYGPHGMAALENVIRYAREKGLLVVLDGKRNDIGSTAQAYAEGILGRDSVWGADALTVSPYLGDDSLEPFIQVAAQRDAGLFILVKTSNPGGAMLQDLTHEGQPIYRHVARYVHEQAESSRREGESYGSVGAVVGATWPEQLAELRQAMDAAWLLVPGFGSQGGSAKDVAAAFDENGYGAIINNSRGIIFAYRSEKYRMQPGSANWQSGIERATLDMIDALRSETSAGKLG